MENSKHTQGEWKTEGTNVLTENRLIANCIGNGASITEEDKANAKIIAASLNLLEAALMVQKFVKFYKEEHGIDLSMYEAIGFTNQAIEKATK